MSKVTKTMIDAALPWLANYQHMRATDKRNAVESAIAAALSTQPQAPQGDVTGWQPIETAPKDGTDIQLWARGVWYPECSWGMQTYPGNSERVTWVYQDDYDCNGPVFTKVIDPSHWMPPPAAPETPEGKK